MTCSAVGSGAAGAGAPQPSTGFLGRLALAQPVTGRGGDFFFARPEALLS